MVVVIGVGNEFRRDDGAGQTAAPHLVHAAHVDKSDAAQRILEGARRGDS